ncbi:hypothetical protein BC831DRAFT_404491 [Entophlyctis helioformis]|nr:hypothetical protein BC831DRAFT_404491 [Entophlyctis helioformis]
MYLESELRDQVAAFFKSTSADPSAYVHAIKQIAQEEVSVDEQVERERHELHEQIQNLGAVVAERKKQEKLSTDKPESSDKKAQRGSEKLQSKLDDLKATLERRLNKDADRVAKLEQEISEAMVSVNAASVDDTAAHDPWVEYDGQVLRISEIESVDECVSDRCRSDHKQLVGWFRDSMARLQTAYADVGTDRYGGWTQDQHERFEKIRDEYAAPEVRGRHGLLTERYRLELPFLTVRQIENHDAWMTRRVAFKAQKRALRRALETRMQELVHTVLAACDEARAFYLQHAESQKDRDARLARLEISQDRLRVWRDARIRQLRAAAELRVRALEEQMEADRIKAEAEALKRDMDRQKIDAYHEARRAAMAKQVEMAARISATLAAEIESQKQINEERVQYREAQRQHKLEDRRAEALKAQERRDALQRQLDALRQTVAVDAKSDWSRILSDTVAFAESKKPADEPDWYKTTSFTTDKVMKDVRTQVSHALYKQGVQTTAYARTVLNSLQPKHPVRPDQRTTLQLG